MLQVKDPQQVFDEIVKTVLQSSAGNIELTEEMLNFPYSIFVLGEMYGTVSTCLAQNIPIPKELWDNPTVQSFVMGDVDDVVVVNRLEQVADIVREEMPEMSTEVFG